MPKELILSYNSVIMLQMVESSEVNLQNVREELLKLTQRLLARDGTYVDIWENEDGGSIGLGVSDTPDGHVAIQSWKSS